MNKRIKNLENIRDNMMYIVGMFDPNNQRVLAGKLSTEAKKAIHDRIEAGGWSRLYVYKAMNNTILFLGIGIGALLVILFHQLYTLITFLNTL